MDEAAPLPRYRLLTGPDDAAFCQRVSDALDEGYDLHGSPSVTFDGDRVIAAQALVRRRPPARERSGPSSLADVPYEYAATAGQASLVFTAGACPLDAAGRVVGLGDHRRQANVAFDNLVVVLGANDVGPGDLVRTTIYVVGERADLIEVWDTVAGRLAPARPPSTLVGVPTLGYDGQLVEIEGIAAGVGGSGVD